MKKLNKLAKSTLSVVMALLMLMSILTVAVTSVSAVTGTNISYTFTGKDKNTAGYAEGTITLSTDTAGTYYLYWADNTKALDGYYPILTMTLAAQGSNTFNFGYHTAIPAGATKIIATNNPSDLNVSTAEAVYNVPANKQFLTGSGQEKYSFSSFSDVHIDPDGYYQNYEGKWAQALEFSYKKGADFIVSSGDMVNNGRDDEWERYLDVLSKSNFDNPVWESNGNHDLKGNEAEGLKQFVKSTGTDSTIANFDANKPYYSVTEKTTGDLFIFMALEIYLGHQGNAFSDAQLNWVSKLLEDNYGTGKNIYIIEHSPINGFGAGDRMENPYYGAHLSQQYMATVKFKSLLQKYPEVIWMSGHTHIDYEMGYNYSDENDTACNMIHNSAVVGSTWAEAGATSLDYNNGSGRNSQGYLVKVYENEVVYQGANLTEEKYYPAHCYIMEGARNVSKTDVNETDPITTAPAPEKFFSLPGSFNGWSTSEGMTRVDATHYAVTYELASGNHSFKVNDGVDWYGNSGTINDTTAGIGWTMSKDDSSNCKLSATGGFYTFTLDSETMKLEVERSDTKPTEPTEPPTEAPTTVPTQPPVKYQLGDVNRDTYLNISDATSIQKYLAKLITFDDEQYSLANINQDEYVNVKDATYIQLVLAKLVEAPTTQNLKMTAKKTVNSVGASTLSSVLTTAKTKLTNYYMFASYDQYQAVKKMYNTYKNTTSTDANVVADFETRLAVLEEIVTHIGIPVIYDVKDTYYFVNTQRWSEVYGYAWTGSSTRTSWPGDALEKCGTYNGYDVYGIKFNVAGQFENMIFNNNNGTQTVDISLNDYQYNCFTPGSMVDGKYEVSNFEYKDATKEPTAPGSDVVITDDNRYALCYYNKDAHAWADIDTYFKPQSDGTYVLNFTTKMQKA